MYEYLVVTAGEILSFDVTDHDEADLEKLCDRSGLAVQIENMARAVRKGGDPTITGYERTTRATLSQRCTRRAGGQNRL